MTVSLKSNFFSNARGITFEDANGVAWSFDPVTNQLTATTSGGGGSGTVTSIGSTSLTIGGTSAVPTVNLSSTQISNIAAAGTALQSASVVDSVTGTGVSGSPLQLSGDSASPGNSFYYGTNASGTKGWFTLPSGSSTQFNKGAGWNSSSGAISLPSTVPVDVIIPYACTLQEVDIITSGGSGSCVIDVWKAASLAEPTSANDITGGSPPAISAGTGYANSTLSGWTTSFAQNDRVKFTLASTSVFTEVTIILRLK